MSYKHTQFNPEGPWPDTFHPIMLDLYDILRENHNGIKDFIEAIKIALSKGLEELHELEIKTPQEYISFMNYLTTWNPREKHDGRWVYVNLVTFYFIFNLPPLSNNTALQSPIKPQEAGQKQAPVTKWLVDYAIIMGDFMATAASWSKRQEETFWTADKYNMDRYLRPEGGWKSFNDFFSRRLVKPNPVDGASDDSVIVSPADCTYSSPLIPVNSKTEVCIKEMLWDIDELIGIKTRNLGSPVPANAFAGGKFIHAFLAPYDYHRQHAPVSGKVVESRVIQGQCYLEVILEEPKDGKHGLLPGRPRLRPVRPIRPPPDGGAGYQDLDAPDSAGYQFLQTRGVIVIENDKLGYVAVLPVGMAQVSSVVPTVNVGDYVEKGQEICYFQMGGSDIIMVFQEKANVELVVPIAGEGTHKTQGQKVIKAHLA